MQEGRSKNSLRALLLMAVVLLIVAALTFLACNATIAPEQLLLIVVSLSAPS
jgi:hypothetical protein